MEEQDLAVIIGKNIMRLRKAADMTQSELAEKLNYSDKSVSKWEQGNGIPDVRILVQIAEYFHVSVDDLLREQPAKPVLPARTKLFRRLVILALSVGLCWLAAVVCFVLGGIISPATGGMWLAFVYAVPASAVVVVVFSCVWSWKWVRFVSVSLLVWSTLACAYLTVWWVVPHPTLWLIFLIGVPLQFLAVFGLLGWKRLRFFK